MWACTEGRGSAGHISAICKTTYEIRLALLGEVCFVFENATGKSANSVFLARRKGKEEAEAVNLVPPFFPPPPLLSFHLS